QSLLHNPTGWNASAANLHQLLRLAERYELLLAEDDVYSDLHPGGGYRLAQLSNLQRVIYFGSFCKILSPALRVGYLAAEPALVKDAYLNGILLARGALFRPNGEPDSHLRFNVAYGHHSTLADYLGERLASIATLETRLAGIQATAR